MNDLKIKEVERITHTIYKDFCHGDTETWFSVLHPNCIWVATGEPMLIGSERIKEYFTDYPTRTDIEIITESYTTLVLDQSTYIVTGNVLVGSDITLPSAKVLMTMVYRYTSNTPKLSYQNMSYDFIKSDSSQNRTNEKGLYTDLATRLFFKQTLANKNDIPPISVKVGQQLYFIPPASIIYLQSNRHKTSIHCIDKVIECSMLITDIQPQLPNNFYFLRRGCIVNTMYITAIRRCEVELVFGTNIQVPAAGFTTVKKEINEMIMRSQN